MSYSSNLSDVVDNNADYMYVDSFPNSSKQTKRGKTRFVPIDLRVDCFFKQLASRFAEFKKFQNNSLKIILSSCSGKNIMKHKNLLKITMAAVLWFILLFFIANAFFEYEVLNKFYEVLNKFVEIGTVVSIFVAFIQIGIWGRQILKRPKNVPQQPKLKPLDRLRQHSEAAINDFFKANLHHDPLITLGKELQPGRVIPAASRMFAQQGQKNQLLAENEPILDVFQQRANRALLILGEPGAGKTTTLVELAEALIELQKQDSSQPVPVIFNLASWADKQASLQAWMVDELRALFGIPKEVGKSWVEKYEILPLLDGLDEVREDARLACVEAINALPNGLTGLVVCCRIEEYESLGQRLELKTAIALQPLQREQIFTYVEAGGESLATLKQLLQQDKDMLTLAETPLMLSVMSVAYENATENVSQTTHSLEEKRRALFDRYIDQMFVRRPTHKKVYSKEKTLHYLSWLADRLHTQGKTVFLVENLQPSWLQSVWGYKLLSGLFWGVFVSGWLLLMEKNFLYISLSWGVGMFFWWTFFATVRDIETKEILGWSFEKFSQHALKKMLFKGFTGLFAGLLVGLFFALFLSLLEGLFFGLLVGLLVGLFYGLLQAGLENQIPDKKAVVNQGIVESWKNFLRFGIPFGIVAGSVLWIGMAMVDFATISIASFLLFLAIGIFFGFFLLGGLAVIQHYTLRFILFLEGYTPFNYVRFLDESAKLIFLKKVGGAYIFIHRLFLEHLAEKWKG